MFHGQCTPAVQTVECFFFFPLVAAQAQKQTTVVVSVTVERINVPSTTQTRQCLAGADFPPWLQPLEVCCVLIHV